MERIFAEAEQELEDVVQSLAQRPKAAITRILQMALEREEIVSTAYRHALIMGRLERMRVSDDVRKLIEHAIVWLWKDEEMHALYARGALWRLGGFFLRTQALMQQASGIVAGWSTSIKHHSQWRMSPFSCLAASMVTLIGRLVGKVPHEIGLQLRSVSFRDFCLLNAEMEKASWLSWDRVALLAEQQGIMPQMLPNFHQVAMDEIRHKRVFMAIAASLTPEDELLPDVTANSLAADIAKVSPHFLPREHRQTGNPLGSGGRVWSVTARPEETARKTLRRTLEESGLAESLQQQAKQLGKSVTELQVTIKTCFMLGYNRQDPSPLVAPELIYETVDFLLNTGCTQIKVAESRNIYDHFFAGRTVREVAAYFGLQERNFQLVDMSEEQVEYDYGRGIGLSTVSRIWRDADFRISLGKLRSHPIELALLGLGNLEGVGGRTDQFLFAERQASRATALMMLLDEFPCHFSIIDAFANVPDGLVGMMGCVRPKSPRRFYAGVDTLAVDGMIGHHLGWRLPEDSSLVAAACHWFGGWPKNTEVVGTDTPIANWRGPHANDWHSFLSLISLPVYVWGSNRGSLFVPAMDTKAFPLLKKPSLACCWTRYAVRKLVGLPMQT